MDSDILSSGRMLDVTDRDWLEAIPKVELHVHLEGAIPQDALWELVKEHGGDPEVPTQEALAKKFVYRDFPHFIETWVWKNGFLRTYDDFEFIAERVALDWQAQGICYSEAFYSPGDFARHGLNIQPLTQAIRSGLSKVPDVQVNLVADLIRDFGPAQAAKTLQEVREVADQGVIGIGIGGSEQEFPPEPFEDVFEMARGYGFKTSAHAGEAAGAASVRAAWEVLKVDRIGHATRAIEDEDLLKLLVREQVPLELCPISNLRTGAVSTLSSHPVRTYFDLGVSLSVNTDDPHMFGNSLADEYEQMMLLFAFSREEIRQILLSTVSQSWLPEEDQKRLAASLKQHPRWNSDRDAC